MKKSQENYRIVLADDHVLVPVLFLDRGQHRWFVACAADHLLLAVGADDCLVAAHREDAPAAFFVQDAGFHMVGQGQVFQPGLGFFFRIFELAGVHCVPD